jgi:hypothetical protein
MPATHLNRILYTRHSVDTQFAHWVTPLTNCVLYFILIRYWVRFHINHLQMWNINHNYRNKILTWLSIKEDLAKIKLPLTFKTQISIHLKTPNYYLINHRLYILQPLMGLTQEYRFSSENTVSQKAPCTNTTNNKNHQYSYHSCPSLFTGARFQDPPPHKK